MARTFKETCTDEESVAQISQDTSNTSKNFGFRKEDVEKQKLVLRKKAAVSLPRKLLLGSLLFCNEAGIVFEQLYAIPMFQLLGMPLRYSQLTGVGAGPVATALVFLLGWLSDKGSNPARRKSIGLALTCATMVVGLLCVTAANIFHLGLSESCMTSWNKSCSVSNMTSYNMTESTPNMTLWNSSDRASQCFDDVGNATRNSENDSQAYDQMGVRQVVMAPCNTSQCVDDGMKTTRLTLNESTDIYQLDISEEVAKGDINKFSLISSSTKFSGGRYQAEFDNQTTTEDYNDKMKTTTLQERRTELEEENKVSHFQQDTTKIPFSAWLAMFGFVLYEIGYDTTNSYVRARLLEGGPRAEQTSLLALGMVMGSAGGITMSVLENIDFTPLLGAVLPERECPESNTLSIQTSIQAAFLIFIIITGFILTMLASRGLKGLSEMNTDSNSNRNACSSEGSNDKATADADKQSLFASAIVLFRSGLHSSGAGSEDSHLVSQRGHSVSICSARTETIPECDYTEKLPERHVTSEKSTPITETSETAVVSECNSLKCYKSYGAVEYSEASSLLTESTITMEDISNETSTAAKKKDAPSFVKGMSIICAAMFFMCGTSYMYSYLISDYVGKAVYGGDPRAEPGTEEHVNYVTGVRIATEGFMVYSATYLAFSLVHTKVLNIIGHKAEFVLVQTVMAGCMVLLAVTARLEVFFLLSVVAGIHRACAFVVPFDAANNVAQAEAESGRVTKGPPRVGLAVSLVSGMVPLAYVFLYPWVGPLEEITGIVSTPMWVGAVLSVLAAVCYVFV